MKETKSRGIYDLRDLPRWDIIAFNAVVILLGIVIGGLVFGHPIIGGILGFIFSMFVNTTTR